MKHIYKECEQPCDGGLVVCTVCNGAEASLPKECPGESMSEDLQQRVINGDLDFQDGEWEQR